jgi:hypothetical protein
LAGELARHVRKGKPIPRGGVFYHAQDAERADAVGELMVRYGQIHHLGNADVPTITTPITTAQIGREVADVLRAHGLVVDWDGNPDRCLRVNMADTTKG